MQRSILATYHVTDANSFYSGDDAWQTPQEPTKEANSDSSSSDSSAITNTNTNGLGVQTTTTTSADDLQDPYYLTMKVPGSETKYSLYTTYIPQQSGRGADSRNVLTGYLAVDSDAGGAGKGKKASGYGKLTLLTMPKTDNIPGPLQVQNLFNSDTNVSQELNILKRGNSTVKQGNLLTLPVGGGFLYVQPVYVQSTSSGSYPLLQKVLVAFGDKIAFEDTLDQALDTLFGGNSGANAGDQGVSDGSSDSGSGSGSSDSGRPAVRRTPARRVRVRPTPGPLGRARARAARTTPHCRRPSTRRSRRSPTVRPRTRRTTSWPPPRRTSGCRTPSRRRPRPRAATDTPWRGARFAPRHGPR